MNKNDRAKPDAYAPKITLFHTFFEIHIDLNLSIKTTMNIILIISAYQILSYYLS